MTETTIAAQVRRMHQDQPADPRDPMAREQAALAAGGVPDGVAALGSLLPDAELLDAEGRPTALHAVRGGRRAVIVLYRGAWCPYCNLALSTYQRVLLPQLDERDVALIAISPQHPDGSLSIQEKHGLGFAVLSDPGNQVARALGVLTTPSDGVLEMQAGLGLELGEANADGTTELPMPTTVVVDADGAIRWIDVHPDYSGRSEPEDIVAAVDTVPVTVRLGILAMLEAKPGRSEDLAAFLEQGRALAVAENGTVTWYAFRLDDSTFGIFDSFETEAGRRAHITGEIPLALTKVSGELLAREPDIRPVDIVAVK